VCQGCHSDYNGIYSIVASRLAQQREALRQAELLFDTLLHRAFRGELGAGDAAAVEVEAALAGAPAGNGVKSDGELVEMGMELS